MLHCVWADCCSDRPLGGRFSSQVSEHTSSDTRVKSLVFRICRWLPGESACLRHVSKKIAQVNKEKDGAQEEMYRISVLDLVSQMCEKEVFVEDGYTCLFAFKVNNTTQTVEAKNQPSVAACLITLCEKSLWNVSLFLTPEWTYTLPSPWNLRITPIVLI